MCEGSATGCAKSPHINIGRDVNFYSIVRDIASRYSGSMMRTENTSFTTIQGLRGLAALWVVLFHLYKSAPVSAFTNALPSPFTYAIFGYGSAGVAVFFVISGFVIAHSLNGKRLDGRAFGLFVAKRSIRLDPPYWASMAVTVSVGAALAIAHHQPPSPPSAWQIMMHVLYLQDFVGVAEIQPVYWTLVYEVQFYLIFASSLWLGNCLNMHKAVQWALLALALFSGWQGGEWAVKGLFVNLWHGFFLGVLAYRAGVLKESLAPPVVLVAVVILCQRHDVGVFATPAGLTAITLLILARGEKLTKLLSCRAWQWMGKISYSLYLIHIPIFMLLSGLWQRIFGRGLVQDTGAAFFLVGASICGAAVFYWVFERPSQALAKRLAAPQRQMLNDVERESIVIR